MRRPKPITAREFRQRRVLRLLADCPPGGTRTARDISIETGIRQSVVVGALMALERRFEAQRDSIREDRTAARWSISEIGRRAI